MNNTNNKKSIIDVLKSRTRFLLFSLLHLYPELSLSELSKKMSKSKSTIHHHLKEFIERDIIELSRQEKVRGNILAKFYSLKPGYIEKLNQTDHEIHKGNSASLEFIKTYIDFAIRNLQLYKNFFDINESNEENLEFIKEILNRGEGFSSMLFLSKEQFKKIQVLYKDFIKKVQEIEKDEIYLKKEKPFYMFTLALPLKDIIEGKRNSSVN